MKIKKALIFGVSGQDGAFLAKHLINKNYNVFGIIRNKNNLKNLSILGIQKKVKLYSTRYYEYEVLKKIIIKNNINEIYFLDDQVKPILASYLFYETVYSNLIPVYYIIDIILKNNRNIRFFNSSSCEIFKKTNKKLNENSKKFPDTIYGLSKLLSYEMVKFFREKYNLKICSGIMFHHESQLKEKNLDLRNIIISTKDIYLKKKNKLNVGNIDIVKDWGWAPEYVKLIYKLNNQTKIEDIIVATGNSYKLKQLVKKIFEYYNLNWLNYIQIDKNLVRKNDALVRRADNRKIKKKMNWKPKVDAQEIIIKLIENQLY